MITNDDGSVNTDWHFCDVFDRPDEYTLYLCWRAVGYDRWLSLYNALNRYIPANWAMLFPDEDEEASWERGE